MNVMNERFIVRGIGYIFLIVLRLMQRAVEWPVPTIFGLALFLGLIFSLGIQNPSLQLLSGLLLAAFLAPLGQQGPSAEINTEQALWLAGFWYVVYAIGMEIISVLWSRKRPNRRPIPVRLVTFGFIVIVCTAVGVVLASHVNGGVRFEWPMLFAAWVAAGVAGICLGLSSGLAKLQRGVRSIFGIEKPTHPKIT